MIHVLEFDVVVVYHHEDDVKGEEREEVNDKEDENMGRAGGIMAARMGVVEITQFVRLWEHGYQEVRHADEDDKIHGSLFVLVRFDDGEDDHDVGEYGYNCDGDLQCDKDITLVVCQQINDMIKGRTWFDSGVGKMVRVLVVDSVHRITHLLGDVCLLLLFIVISKQTNKIKVKRYMAKKLRM